MCIRLIQFNLINSGLGLERRMKIKRDPYGNVILSNDEESPVRFSALIVRPPWTRIYLERCIYLSTYKARAVWGIQNWRWTVVGQERNDLKSRHVDERGRKRDGVRNEDWARELFYDEVVLCQFSLRETFSETWWENRQRLRACLCIPLLDSYVKITIVVRFI